MVCEEEDSETEGFCWIKVSNEVRDELKTRTRNDDTLSDALGRLLRAQKTDEEIQQVQACLLMLRQEESEDFLSIIKRVLPILEDLVKISESGGDV